ncbi:hypothetical protein ACOSQ3_023336 [Xanthoceras sorbifolium]
MHGNINRKLDVHRSQKIRHLYTFDQPTVSHIHIFVEKNWRHSIYVVKPPINLRETSTGKDRKTLLDPKNNYNLSLIF